MESNKEKLLIELMHFLSERFKDRLVLEGGMLLRLFNSPRSTQDIDCFLLSDRSKKELSVEIKKALAGFKGASVLRLSLNSRGIFVELDGGADVGKVMIEVGVVHSLNLPAEQFSTVSLSSRYAISGRIISVIALPEAFANKIAACIERENVRDLYDLSVFEPLSGFDEGTLVKRLEKVSIKRRKIKKLSPAEAAEVLKDRAASLTDRKMSDELYPLIPPEQRPGLLVVIKSAVAKIAERIRQM